MANFKISQAVLKQDEGLHSNDPDDNGGETVWGITRNLDTKWPGWAVIDAKYKNEPGYPQNLRTPEIDNLVDTYYISEYWNPIRGDEINSQDEATQIYKSYVNTGSEGIILAQRALGIHESGKMDDVTLNALNNKS